MENVCKHLYCFEVNDDIHIWEIARLGPWGLGRIDLGKAYDGTDEFNCTWYILRVIGKEQPISPSLVNIIKARKYREYNPNSAGTRRDECLVGDSRRQVLVDGDKDIEVVQE